MNILTKEFWLQVQEEFEENPSHFLCWASDTFERAFTLSNINAENYFADLAETFLNEHPQWAACFKSLNNYCLLFKTRDPANTPNSLRQQVRKEFVDWMVQKLNTKDDKTRN